MSVAGKTVLVTGASRGIGAAAAAEFAQAGARVVLAARTIDAITQLSAALTDAGHQSMAVACDVADYGSVSRAVTAGEAAFGPVDILVNNAGTIDPIGLIAESDPAAWSQAIDVNLKGVFYGARAVLPAMMARRSGVILTVGSGAAHGPMEGWAHYNAGKAGALMLTRAIDKEAGPAGIISVNLSPGTVATQMQREIKASGINPISELDWSDHIPPDWPARAGLAGRTGWCAICRAGSVAQKPRDTRRHRAGVTRG